MKKRTLELLSILLLLTLSACGVNSNTDTASLSIHSESAVLPEESEGGSPATDPEQRKQVTLDIDASRKDKIMIPDPTKITEDRITILLQPEIDVDEFWNEEMECYEDCKLNSRYAADLSFAGLGNDVMVSSFATGNMTDPHSEAEDCLALFVHEKQGTDQEKNYLLVIDYGNGTYYKTETTFILTSWAGYTDLQVRDLTGDGTQELVVSDYYDTVDTRIGIFRCDEQTHTLIPIFSTLNNSDKESYDPLFSATLRDDYKVMLEFPEIHYSNTVSMIHDGGYSQKELEINSKQGKDSDEIGFVALWKNGKLKQLNPDFDNVYLYTLAHMDFITEKSGKPQLELVRGICVRYRSEQIGNMHMFLQYDPKEERLVLKKARYVNKKEALKELKTFHEWQER